MDTIKDQPAVPSSTTSISTGRERTLTQYLKRGNVNIASPDHNTIEKLEPGVYSIYTTMEGSAVFERVEVKSDSLIRLNNNLLVETRQEMKKFWENKAKFDKMGFTHKRGIMFHGKPGTGKSMFLKSAMEDMVSDGNVTFIAKSVSALVPILRAFREVEPERPVAVMLEDVDELIRWDEQSLLELMDGPNSVGGVFYVGTTNYIERIPERLLRKSRFDKKIEIGAPSEEDRLEYFKAKLGTNESDDQVKKLAKASDGMVFADMKDLLVAIYCLDIPVEKAVAEMRGGGVVTWGNKMGEKDFNQKFESMMTPRLDKGLVQICESSESPTATETNKGSKAAAILQAFEEVETPVSLIGANGIPSDDRIKDALTAKIAMLNLDDVTVQEVIVDTEGNIVVDFGCADDTVTVVFSYDPDEGSTAIVWGGEDDDVEDGESYSLVVDLDPLCPSIIQTSFGMYVNLTELSWLSKSIILTLLDAGEYDIPTNLTKKEISYDEYGNVVPAAEARIKEGFNLERYKELYDEKKVLQEVAYKVVIRGGKKERLPIIRRQKKKRLTAKQRAGLRKAARTRRSATSKMKRKRSLALRKRMHLKNVPVRKGYRVGG
jgi:hypothetical protein